MNANGFPLRLLHKSLILWRVASQPPLAALAACYEWLSVALAFGKAIWQHVDRVEPIQLVDHAVFEQLLQRIQRQAA